MSLLTVFEFDVLVPGGSGGPETTTHAVPPQVFDWLESLCQAAHDEGEGRWIRRWHHRGRPAVQMTSFVGVLRAPGGFQIEVLPKVGKALHGGIVEARRLLLDMLGCLPGFRHIRRESAALAAQRMPLLEVFIADFLQAVDAVVKRGLRGDYMVQLAHLPALRGKLLVGQHLRDNLCRPDRFFTEHDEFTTNRPENRLLRAALRRCLHWTAAPHNQRLARELDAALSGIPASGHPGADFDRVRLDRGMGHYGPALAWARMILAERSPLAGHGEHEAPSLLFPMEAVFEAFVAAQLARKIARRFSLKTQARSHHLVRHGEADWFCLKPDMVVHDEAAARLVLDTKWKLLDASQPGRKDKYGLAQGDVHQLQAYGQSYLDGQGDVVLVYPRTMTFDAPPPVFEFPRNQGLRLWVVPFCLHGRRLCLPAHHPLQAMFT
jgi:5-methylcytosine-specific restriction enzyme subunit McrC